MGLSAAAVLALCAATDANAQIHWSLTELTTPGNAVRSFATGINNLGSVVGMNDPGAQGGGGQSIGSDAWLAPADGSPAVRLAASFASPLATRTGVIYAGGINDAGVIAGYVERSDGVHLTTWSAGTNANFGEITGTDRGTPLFGTGIGGAFFARGINGNGQIVGNGRAGQPYVWDAANGYSSLVSQFGGNYGVALPSGINNAGVVVGSLDYGNGSYGSFLSKPGSTIVSPGAIVGYDSALKSVSSLTGPLVGITDHLNMTVGTDQNGAFIGFDYDNFCCNGRASMRPLVDPTASGATLAFANAINDYGQIAGQSSNGIAAIATPYGTLTWKEGGSYNGIAPANHNFSDAANWSGSTTPWLDNGSQPLAPNKFLDANIAAPNGYAHTVLLDVDATVKSVIVGDATGQFYGQFEIGTGRTLKVIEGLSVQAGGTLIGSGGTIVLAPAAGSPGAPEVFIGTYGVANISSLVVAGGVFHNAGTITGVIHNGTPGTLSADLVNDGTFRVQAGQAFSISGNQHFNNGYIKVDPLATLTVHGALRGYGGYDISGEFALNDSGPQELHNVHVFGGGKITGIASITSGSNFRIDTGAQVQTYAYTQTSGSLVVDGTLDANQGGGPGAVVSLLGGVLSGTGSINGALFVGGGPTTASFEPGHSPGHFTVDGAITLGDKSELELQVEREADGALAWDRVSGSSISFLDGSTVRFIIGSGVADSNLQTLSFLDCGSGCSFSSKVNWVIDGAPGATVAFGSNGLSLSIAAVQAVPEPAIWALSLAGLALVAGQSRRLARGGARGVA